MNGNELYLCTRYQFINWPVFGWVGVVSSKIVYSKADRRNARKIFEHIFSRISHLRNARKNNARKYLLELGTRTGNWNWELSYSSKYFRAFFVEHFSKRNTRMRYARKKYARIYIFVIRKCEFGQFVWNWARHRLRRLLAKA